MFIWVVTKRRDARDHWTIIDLYPPTVLPRAFPLAAPKPELSPDLC